MNSQKTQIEITGDPFVDAGALAMAMVPGKTREEKIEFAMNVYIEKWENKLHSLFLNSPITQSSYNTNQKKKEKTLEYFQKLWHQSEEEKKEFCRTCGREAFLRTATRSDLPLSGSGKYVNYHHGHEAALMLCQSCITKLFFLPFATFQCGSQLALIQMQTHVLIEFWKDFVVKENLDKIGKGTSCGILKKKIRNPQNALFFFTEKIIHDFQKQLERESLFIKLFHFSNFGASPDVMIYDLPNIIFDFFYFVSRQEFEKDWQIFAYSYFRIKKATFDKENRVWIDSKGTPIPYEEFVNYPNPVYQRLLNGQSILGMMFSVKQRSLKLPIKIIIYYLQEVRAMRKEQVRTIQTLAHKILDLAEKDDSYNKFITPIEGARRAWELRAAILRAAKAHFKSQATEPLVTFQEYTENLFGEDQYWGEVRDALLICLYEEMHNRRIDTNKVEENIAIPVTQEDPTMDSF